MIFLKIQPISFIQGYYPNKLLKFKQCRYSRLRLELSFAFQVHLKGTQYWSGNAHVHRPPT
jgi:hypothetical protein